MIRAKNGESLDDITLFHLTGEDLTQDETKHYMKMLSNLFDEAMMRGQDVKGEMKLDAKTYCKALGIRTFSIFGRVVTMRKLRKAVVYFSGIWVRKVHSSIISPMMSVPCFSNKYVSFYSVSFYKGDNHVD